MQKIIWCLAFVLFIGNIVLAKSYFVAVVKSSEAAPYQEALQGFKKNLLRKNIEFKLKEYVLLTDWDKVFLGAEKPDLILTLGSKATDLVCKKVSVIPIVFAMVMNPQFRETNIAGVSLDVPLSAIFKIFKKILPKSQKIGLLYDPLKSKKMMEEGLICAQEAGLEIVAREVNSAADVYGAIRAIGKNIEGLWMIPDSTVYTERSGEDILLYTLREKIPAIGFSPSCVKAGALFALSCNFVENGSQSADVAMCIFRGEKPADIGILSPETIDLSINLITAQRLEKTIPPQIVDEANNVYQ